MSLSPILVTGATGYIGGRLRSALERIGQPVRCLARRPAYLAKHVQPQTEIVQGDVLDYDSLRQALHGVESAFYLVHSMGSPGSFEEKDRIGAENFARAARDEGVRRIIYVGGLGDSRIPLSPHLRSRHEVGQILRDSGVQTIEIRASIVIGAGSLSFEMIRALAERLPVMVTPRWVSIPAQPIAIADLLDYLIGSLELDLEGSHTFEVGGKEVVTYGDLLREYARQRGLRRLMIPVPFLTPRLSSLWLGLVTPLYARVGRKLIESVYHPTVVRDDKAIEIFGIEPMGAKDAVALALAQEDAENIETRWSDALSAANVDQDWGGARFGNRLVDSRCLTTERSPEEVFSPIRRIGGDNGWYFGDWLWKARGAIDLMVGGVGLRRGRSHPDQIEVGDVIDCWRVENFDPPHRLRLKAEMKLPGRAWLEFEARPKDGGTEVHQTAIFDPIGLSGLLYWYGIYPLHEAVFAGMIRGIVRQAELRSPSHTRAQASRAGAES